MKSSAAENFSRSTREPRIRQQVIAANVAWKPQYTNSYSGVALLKVAAIEKLPVAGSNMPFRNSRLNPPKNGFPVVKAIEYPYTHHRTVIREKPTNTCIRTDSMFLLRTR